MKIKGILVLVGTLSLSSGVFAQDAGSTSKTPAQRISDSANAILKIVNRGETINEESLTKLVNLSLSIKEEAISIYQLAHPEAAQTSGAASRVFRTSVGRCLN
jgi:endoglucanase Acf2